MNATFDTWFSRFMWGTDIVFLAASTPHIAAWYAHFDNPTDPINTAYAWIVGFGLAVAIDGVSLMLLFALTRMIKHGEKNRGTKAGILFFMAFIAGLSWLINWQYDTQFASTAFQKVDHVSVNLLFQTVTVGTLNPIIGGAFSVLIMAYALIGKVIKDDDQSAPAPMTDAEYEAKKTQLLREKELKELIKSDRQGLLSRGKETLLGQSTDALNLLDKTLAYLRDADELRRPENEQRALQALSAYLKMKSKDVLPLLIQGRSIIAREEQETLIIALSSDDQPSVEPIMIINPSNDEGIDHSIMTSSSSDDEDVSNPMMMNESLPDDSHDDDPLHGLNGRDMVSLERAAKALDCQIKHVITLRNQGKLKHSARRDDRITVASLRVYLASHKGKKEKKKQPIPPASKNGNGHHDAMISASELVPLIVE